MATPLVYVAGALAISLAANAWLGSGYVEKREEIAALRSAGQEKLDNITRAANACSASVNRLAAEEQATRDQVAKAIEANEKASRGLLTEAKRALAAKPDNPADLCGSADRYLSREIKARRAAAAASGAQP
jgi:hypothetical protein